MRKLVVLLVSFMALGLCAPVYADWVTGFETAGGYTGSPGGTILTGQPLGDPTPWTRPSGTDYNVYTYVGNTYGIVQNPQGGEQFIGGRSLGTAFARAEHVYNWDGGDVWKSTVDVAALYTGALPAANNLGSFSLQPSTTSKYWQHLITWVDTSTATQFNVGYLTAENPGAPALFPGPEWQNLPVNRWYQLSTTFRLSNNLILEVAIKDLTTGLVTTVQPTGWHLLQGTMPVPAALRFFSGGAAGNFVAWDNLSIVPGPPPPVGACCNGVSCALETQWACEHAGGRVYLGDNSTCSPNPCSGACCRDWQNPPGNCDDNTARADCQLQGGRFAAGTLCANLSPPCSLGACCMPGETPPCDVMDLATCESVLGHTWIAGTLCDPFPCPPPNDQCADPCLGPTLVSGETVTFTGNNEYATVLNDCAAFNAYPNVWECFTLPNCMDVTLDYCTTPGPFGNAWLNLARQCSPTCTATAAGTTTVCGDGNVTITWLGLAAGTYWYPVLKDPANGAVGSYTLHVVGTDSPPPPPWSDDFDSYVPGSINGQGGWKGWDNVPGAAGIVDNTIWLSPGQSQRINGPADSVREYTGYTCGHWTYTANQFIPSNLSGVSYFLIQNRYNDGGPYNWSVQVSFDGSTRMLEADAGSSALVTMPYTPGVWSQIRVEIYLDEDWTQVYYNNNLLDDPALANHPVLGGGYSWTAGVFGDDTNGLLNIGAVDLYANSASAVYYDDISLLPEPTVACCLPSGLCSERPAASCLPPAVPHPGTRCASNPCPPPCALMGDMNGVGGVNGLDIQCFVNCATGGDTTGCNCACGDFNGDTDVDVADIPGFLAALGV